MAKSRRNWIIAVLILMVVVGGILLFTSDTLQESFGAGSYLSIDEVDITNDGQDAVFRATVVARGSEDIRLSFTEDEINQYINEEGYEAGDGITGSIRYKEQSKSFRISKTDKNLYEATYQKISTGLSSCNLDFCTEERPEGNYYTFFSARDSLFGKCMCGYLNPIGQQGKFTGGASRDFEVDFSIGNAENTLTSDDSTISVGDARVEWVGSLSNFKEVNTPRYDVLFQSSEWKDLIAEDSFQTERNYLVELQNCLGVDDPSTSFGSVSAIELIFSGYDESRLSNCIANYNNDFNRLIQPKTSQYESEMAEFIEDTSFSGNNFIVDLAVPETYPVFTITVDAESIDLKELKGEPRITSCVNDLEIDSGDSKTGTVKVENIGSSGGFFEGSISCTGSVTGSVNDKFVSAGSTGELGVTISGENTDSGTITESCTITVKDQKSGSSDDCGFDVDINYVENRICEPGAKTCLDANTLRICSEDGMDYNTKDCEFGCEVLQGDDRCKSEEPVTCDKWYEVKKMGECKVASAVYWIAGIIALLVVILVISLSNKNKKSRPRLRGY